MTTHAADHEDLSPPAQVPGRTSRRRRIAFAVLLAVAVCGYAALLRKYCSPYAGGADSSGYLNVARLISEGRLITPVPRIKGLAPPDWNYFYQQPLGFEVDRQQGTQAPTYPLGYPLHLLAASVFVDLDYAPILANTVLALAAGALLLGLARELGLPWRWGFAGVAMLWVCPLFLQFTFQVMSDLAATVWVMAAIWCALRARHQWIWALAGGVSVAIAVLVRPSNLLVMLPVALVLGFRARAWLALILAGLPGAVLLAWYQHTLFGGALKTGYGAVGALFAAAHVPHNAWHFAQWILLLLSPPVALAACALPIVRRRSPLHVTLLATWTAVFVGFYVFYYHSGELWWYLRFILPVFPALILAALLVVHHWASGQKTSRARAYAALALLAIALVWEVRISRWLGPTGIKSAEYAYRLTADWAKQHVPANALVLQMQSSGSFAYYTSFTLVRYDLLDTQLWSAVQQAAIRSGRPIYATLYDFEEERAFSHHVPGQWQLLTRLRQVSVWKLVTPDTPATAAVAR